jgi:tetratricopeptide (TPR) repeat protein
MAQPNVFLSHSSKDADFTHRLEADLQAAGAKVYRVSADQPGDFQERINEALAACEYVVLVLTPYSLASKWVKLEINAAIRLKQQGQIKEILPVQAVSVDQKAIPPLWGIFNIFDATGDYASAQDALLRAVGLSAAGQRPGPVGPSQLAESLGNLLVKGQALSARKKYAEAIPLFERATKLDPNYHDAWATLGYLYGKVARWKESLTACDQALALDEKSAWVWATKAVALNNLQRYQEALAACEHALALNPGYDSTTTAWNNKGRALCGLKRYDEALAAYDRALFQIRDRSLWGWDSSDDSMWGEAWGGKARALRALGRTAEADEAERRSKNPLGSQT